MMDERMRNVLILSAKTCRSEKRSDEESFLSFCP